MESTGVWSAALKTSLRGAECWVHVDKRNSHCQPAPAVVLMEELGSSPGRCVDELAFASIEDPTLPHGEFAVLIGPFDGCEIPV